MYQPSEFTDKVGMPIFYFKIINFFLSIKKILSFYTIPFFIFGLYVVLFGEVGGGGFNGFAFQLYLYGDVSLFADNGGYFFRLISPLVWF